MENVEQQQICRQNNCRQMQNVEQQQICRQKICRQMKNVEQQQICRQICCWLLDNSVFFNKSTVDKSKNLSTNPDLSTNPKLFNKSTVDKFVVQQTCRQVSGHHPMRTNMSTCHLHTVRCEKHVDILIGHVDVFFGLPPANKIL